MNSGSVTIAISEISGIAANTSIDHASIGFPPSSTSCFGRPKRVPRPAATITAPQQHHRLIRAKIMRPAAVCSALVTRDVDRFADLPAAVLDHDHRPVIEVADALMRLLSLL